MSNDSIAMFGQLCLGQINQFERYCELLQEWSKKINLTTITNTQAIYSDHFYDSICAMQVEEFSSINSLVDVGAGAGFPGIPLKIYYPHLFVILIEVNKKKIEFLRHIIEVLQLQNITIYEYDWRTFLRKTDYEVDVVCARASLKPVELVRMFKPDSVYKNALLFYWASNQWIPVVKEELFIKKEVAYIVGDKKRKLIMFGQE